MANVILHIDEDLDTEQCAALQKSLAMQEGVVTACINDQHHHLMVLDYDESATNSDHLLQQVESNGLHAELIGL